MNRLTAALEQLGFSRDCDNHFRIELVNQIRNFAVVSGDLELEDACDELLRTIPLTGRTVAG